MTTEPHEQIDVRAVFLCQDLIFVDRVERIAAGTDVQLVNLLSKRSECYCSAQISMRRLTGFWARLRLPADEQQRLRVQARWLIACFVSTMRG